MRLDLVELLDKMLDIAPRTIVASGVTSGIVSCATFWSLIHPTNTAHAATFSLLFGCACAVADWVLDQDEFRHTAQNSSVKLLVGAFASVKVVNWLKIDIAPTRGFVIGAVSHAVSWMCIKIYNYIYNHYFPPKESNKESKIRVNMELNLVELLAKILEILPHIFAASVFAYGLVSHLNYWSLIHLTNAAHAATFSGLLGCAYAVADWVLDQGIFQRIAKKNSVKCLIAGLGLAAAINYSFVKIDISLTRGVVIGAFAHLFIWTCTAAYQHRFSPKERENVNLIISNTGFGDHNPT